ncbi:MAG: hypothetical protein PHF00_11360 [Elusimicrobia bacterium]|nr:hypothetical protein [Elusimicrobiota bacterium]
MSALEKLSLRDAPSPDPGAICDDDSTAKKLLQDLQTVAGNEKYFQAAGPEKLRALESDAGSKMKLAADCLGTFDRYPRGEEVASRHESERGSLWRDIRNQADFIRTAVRLRRDGNISVWGEEKQFVEAWTLLSLGRNEENPQQRLKLASDAVSRLERLSDSYLAYKKRTGFNLPLTADDALKLSAQPSEEGAVIAARREISGEKKAAASEVSRAAVHARAQAFKVRVEGVLGSEEVAADFQAVLSDQKLGRSALSGQEKEVVKKIGDPFAK